MGTTVATYAKNPRPTLTDVRSFGEYATAYRWSLQFYSPPSFTGWPSGIDGGFNVLCASTALPSKSIEKITIGLRGHKHYQPGIVTPSSTIQFHFLENVHNAVHTWLIAWQEATWAHNMGVGVPYDQLTADIAITRFDNSDVPVMAYVLRYCFLETYSLQQLDGTTSGPFGVDITLSYDDFYVVAPTISAPKDLTTRTNLQ